MQDVEKQIPRQPHEKVTSSGLCPKEKDLLRLVMRWLLIAKIDEIIQSGFLGQRK